MTTIKKPKKDTKPEEKDKKVPAPTQIVQVIEREIEKAPEKNIVYSRNQIQQVKDVFAKGATDEELAFFILVSVRTGLDIFKRQIHLVPRWDSRVGKEIFTPQTGIDGYRSIAERTGLYAGNDDAKFEGELEKSYKVTENKKEVTKTYKAPEKATVTVYKVVEGTRCPFTATARWEEYYPGDRMGFMWRGKPHVMLGKCAEALALRKAFPNNIGGVYTHEEMAMQDVQTRPILDGKKIDEMFEKAKKMISTKKDVVLLQEFSEKVESSEKYDDAQKAELKKLIDERIAVLIKENESGK